MMKAAFENLTRPLTKGRLRLSDDAEKTVKTVQVTLARWATPLKRGVNERKSAFLTPVVNLCRPIGSGLVLFICFFMAVAMAKAASVFDDFVRVTEALTPEQELKSFHLPPGFEMQLVASEPEIGKPMNMAFDAQGRIWITQSREYPYAAPLDKPARDKIMVLSDFDAKGHATKVRTFAQGLNIPIGLYPYKNGVIAFSIPNIYSFQD